MRTLALLFLLVSCGPPSTTATAGSDLGVGPNGETPEILTAHNDARRRASAALKDLAWSDALAKSAQAWALKLAAKSCQLEHSGAKYGENLYASSGPSSAKRVVDAWESEAACYTYGKFPDTCDTSRGCTSCGHYTQIVWRDTVNLGCGYASCGNGEVWVCQYDPPGNFNGQFPY